MDALTLSRWDTVREVLAEQADYIECLEVKHPWYKPLWKKTISVLLAAVVLISLVAWAVDSYHGKLDEAKDAGRSEAAAEQAAADQEAERKAQEEQAREDLEDLIEQQTKAELQLLFGHRNFITKYNYTEADIKTIVYSTLNRADARGQDLIEVIFEEGQYTATSRHNDTLSDYYDLVKSMITAWHNGELPAHDTAFQYLETTPYGAFLHKGYGNERWHA